MNISLTPYALRLIAKARAKEAIEKLVQTPEARILEARILEARKREHTK